MTGNPDLNRKQGGVDIRAGDLMGLIWRRRFFTTDPIFPVPENRVLVALELLVPRASKEIRVGGIPGEMLV